MNLITMLLKDGNSIEVNPDQIAYVEKLEEYHVRVVFSGGKEIEVSNSYSWIPGEIRDLQ
jgi:hypothetical protein